MLQTAAGTTRRRDRGLDRMLDDIGDAVGAGGDIQVHVAAALAGWLERPDLLAGIACPCDTDHYARHLLHDDAGLGYAVVAISWRPGQMSPVHGHHTWCALGVHRGWLAESFFRPTAGGLPEPTGCRQRRVGDTSHAAADIAAIHRLANLGTQPAISIHVYGTSFDRFGDGVNLVWAS